MRYHPHQNLIAPALPSASLWRLLLGIFLTAALFLLLSTTYGWLCAQLLPLSAWGIDGYGIEDATTPWGALVNLYAFGLLTLSLALILPLVHKRHLISLFGPLRLAWAQARRVMLYMIGVYIAAALMRVGDVSQLDQQMRLREWLPLLPLSLFGLILQTSAEEIGFRGYLQSQLAARFRHPVVWMGLPAALFGLLHYQPEVMGNASWLIVIWAFLFGLATADLTARSGTLGPAIVFHLINNFTAMALIAPAGYFDGLALASYPFDPEDAALILKWLPLDLMVLLCSWLAARLALRV